MKLRDRRPPDVPAPSSEPAPMPRPEPAAPGETAGLLPLGEIEPRHYVEVEGDVRVLRVRPWADEVSTLECVLDDGTGRITLVFLGRAHVAGIRLGCRIRAEGMVNAVRGRNALLNPVYTIAFSPVADPDR